MWGSEQKHISRCFVFFVVFLKEITFTSRGSPSHGSSLGRKRYPELWRQALWVKKTETNRERSSHVNRAVVTVIKIKKEKQTRTQTWTFELKWRSSELNSFLHETRKSWRKWQQIQDIIKSCLTVGNVMSMHTRLVLWWHQCYFKNDRVCRYDDLFKDVSFTWSTAHSVDFCSLHYQNLWQL